MSSPIAIITPSYAPDFELCRTLNESVLEFLAPEVKHYIFVDRRDLRLFSRLRDERTLVVAKEDILPRDITQLPLLNRWVSRAASVPVSGWLVQQIAKIAVAEILDENVLVMVDSDATFVRDVASTAFARDGKVRLYRGDGAITADMSSHLTWHRTACALLGVPSDWPPVDDYIGQIISWDRALVREMCTRIEQVSGISWYAALVRARNVSEYLLYGTFVEKVAGPERVWIDRLPRCATHWLPKPLRGGKVAEFAESLAGHDMALSISSHSKTSSRARRAVIELATNGRLR